MQVPPKEEEEEEEDDEKTEEEKKEKKEKESDSESDSDSQAEPEQVQGDDQPVLGAIEAPAGAESEEAATQSPAGVAPASRADKLSLGCYIFWYFRGAYLLLSGGDKYRAECGNQKVIH